MFCSRCGKKVLDSMLFCPFCGAEIIIPDQEADRIAPVTEAGPEPVAAERFSFDAPQAETVVETPEPAKGPEPEMDMSWADPPVEEAEQAPEPAEEAPAPAEDEPETETPEAEPPKAEPPKEEPKPEADRPRRTVPVREHVAVPPRRYMDSAPNRSRRPSLDDMFMENDDEDDFDAFEDAVERSERARQARGRAYARRYEEDDEDEDEDDDEEEGFFLRHLRAIVGIVLMLALLGGLVFYAMTDSGQAQLAKVNFTLPFIKAESYSKLGYQAYQDGDFAKAGVYYERALARESGSYNYASSAAMAYLSEENTDKAAEMLRKCAEIKPDAVEPYVYLLNLYPNADTRPWEVTKLVEEGYQRTGDARLKLS